MTIFLVLMMIFSLLVGFYSAASFISALVGAVILFTVLLIAVFVVSYIKELISKDNRPPVAGTAFDQLIHFNRLFDYQTSVARKYPTYRLVMPTSSRSEVYTADPVVVEYILKTNFPNYGKVSHPELVPTYELNFTLNFNLV